MTTKVFPVLNNILQIPVNEFKRFLEPTDFQVSVKIDQVEIEEENCDLDFRELREDEITPEIQAAYKEAKKMPESEWTNITAENS